MKVTYSGSTFSICLLAGLTVMAMGTLFGSPMLMANEMAESALVDAVVVASATGALGSVGSYLGYAVTGVGAASLLLQGISLITGITPSKRDDEYVNEAYRLVLRIQRILDRLAFNPSADRARRK